MGESNDPVAVLFEMTKKALNQKLELGDTEIMISRESVEKMPQPVKEYKNLEEFENDINECTKCPLHEGRNKFVFGVGNPNADIMFVGEGPGRDEDLKGEPFVGRAGKLLDKILAAIHFDRSEVYIGNIVKCRPPNNRDPEPSEMEICLPYLMQQIEMINPRFICCLGRIAAQALLETKLPLGKLRGTFHDWNDRKVLVTYHPAALLRFQQYKRDTWEDVQKLRKAYDEYKASS
ncbi:MAG: uracil-DNA glycosylase [candidate division Zixibacteria bacterium]|nr:uracil-DNA glycosylase [candidate division Zixibacteria bacterium]